MCDNCTNDTQAQIKIPLRNVICILTQAKVLTLMQKLVRTGLTRLEDLSHFRDMSS